MAIQELLEQLASDDGVTAVALVGEDGFVIESVRKEGAADIDFVGGAATSAMASSRALADHLKKGEVEEVMVEYDEGPLLLVPLEAAGTQYSLVLLLNHVQNLGRVRFQLKKVRPQIQEALT